MFVLNFAGMLLFNHSAVIGRDATIKVKSALFSLIFDKLSSVDIRAIGFTNIGHLSDNLTSDMMSIFYCVCTVHYMLISPLVLGVLEVISVSEIGGSSLAGIDMILFFMGATVAISELISKATYAKMGLATERNKEISFAISGIKPSNSTAGKPSFSAKSASSNGKKTGTWGSSTRWSRCSTRSTT